MKNAARTQAGAPGKLLRTVLIWGSLWGIFESTVGYLLHLLPVSLGWFVWYPVACFFMAMTYRRTQNAGAILYVGILSAGIKLFDLLLPVRVDRVINPAVSIVFESIAMFCAVKALSGLSEEIRKKPHVKALAAFSMNTGWRMLYILYLLLIVPDWMREISVISSSRQLLIFLAVHNLATSALIFLPFLFPDRILGRIEGKFASRLPDSGNMAVKKLSALCLLALDILLQLLL